MVYLLEWCWLPIGVAQQRGNPYLNELWGMAGMLTLPLPLLFALLLGRPSPLRQVGWLLGLGLLPSVYFFVRP